MNTPSVNPFVALLHSRKFILGMADAFGATVFVLIGAFLDPSKAGVVLLIAGIWQPVIIAIIYGITVEDNAKVAAEATKVVAAQAVVAAQVTAGVPVAVSSVPPPVLMNSAGNK